MLGIPRGCCVPPGSPGTTGRSASTRASLDAGADSAVIGPWIAETQAKRVAAQAEIRTASGRRTMTRDEIQTLVTALGDLVQVVTEADPPDKAEIYRQLASR